MPPRPDREQRQREVDAQAVRLRERWEAERAAAPQDPEEVAACFRRIAAELTTLADLFDPAGSSGPEADCRTRDRKRADFSR